MRVESVYRYGVVAVNEIIDLAKKTRKECLIFKVDFEKAYDSVSWGFLDYMMRRFGFAVRTAEERNLYTGFKVGNSGMSVSHLQYADDTLFLGEATMENIWSIKAILRGFELALGLKVNFGKSKVMGVNVSGEFLVLEDGAILQRTLPVIDFVNLARVWDSWAASKVIVFSWQLLQDRVPTRQNLRMRRVMVGATDISCVFCGAVEESVDHIFVSCDWKDL
ncbi:hypothetical protein TSUD_232510 [Trifolium subterraneum]|uniref:Reverse transcriptase zinc-binding domain-containing protein n=1 Tax=Trifolium subterraneum TaxID=3900 RepID=A0A2Z6LJE0_TRISU|nr:hypothetical protein TSUD_232510 [Trifolium subterraneum]